MGRWSAGVLLFRRRTDQLEFLLGHPGGPYWVRKDLGAWTLPKGHVEKGEDALSAARREFAEETGGVAPEALVELGEVRLRSGKRVAGFLGEGDFDPAALASIEQTVEWPPRSGQQRAFPELDRVAWFDADEARRRLHPAQAAFIDRAIECLTSGG